MIIIFQEGTKIPDYEIVDWIYDQLEDDEDVFKDSKDLEDEIRNKLDTKGVLDKWLSGNWLDDINEGNNSSGISLGERITDKNEGYISELQSEIDAANKDTIEDIKVDTDYTKTTQDILNTAIEERKKELEDQSEELQAIRDQIASATRQADLADIEVGPIKREYGKGAYDEIRDLLGSKSSSLKTLEEEFRDDMESRISGATTLGALEGLEKEIADVPTTRLESSLLGQIGKRREEIEE